MNTLLTKQNSGVESGNIKSPKQFTREDFQAWGAKGGRAGRGASKARTSEQARAAALKRWANARSIERRKRSGRLFLAASGRSKLFGDYLLTEKQAARLGATGL